MKRDASRLEKSPSRDRIPPLDSLQTEIDSGAEFGLFPAIELELLSDAPVTFLVSSRNRENADLSAALEFIVNKIYPEFDHAPTALFRSVELPRLGQIIQSGCDVVPTSAPLFASTFASKAWEYGGPDKVVMAFDPARLQATFKKVRKSESPALLDQLRIEYPSAKEMDQDWLWFSKLPPGDGRMGTAYETKYSYFIPGNPREALLMVFLVGNDRELLYTEFLSHTKISVQNSP